MIEIIPAINAESFAVVAERIRQVEPYAKRVHIDIADGTYTSNVLWHDPRDMEGFSTPLMVELHLMLRDIDTKIHAWLVPQADRLIVQADIVKNPEHLSHVCHTAGKELAYSLAPSVPSSQAAMCIEYADMLQVLGVVPGRAGQEIQPGTYEKISDLHTAYPQCPIEIDGGMTIDTVQEAAASGATRIVAASAIFEHPEYSIEEAILALRHHAEKTQ